MILGVWISTKPFFARCSLNKRHTAASTLKMAWFVVVWGRKEGGRGGGGREGGGGGGGGGRGGGRGREREGGERGREGVIGVGKERETEVLIVSFLKDYN